MTTVYARPGTSPTPRELEAARAILATDSRAAAAAQMGINTRSLTAHLANLRVRLAARNNEELFYKLRDHLAA